MRSVAFLILCLLISRATVLATPFSFTVNGIDDAADLHGSPLHADLVVFAAGNQFMVMPALIKAFQAKYPVVKRVFYETLPPGIEARQIAAGGLEIGNLTVDVEPDVYMSGLKRMQQERARGVIEAYHGYASNALAIEVARGNPKHVRSLADLGRDDVRVSMPNPKWEGIGKQVEDSFRKVGGAVLDRTIMHDKVDDGTTILTRIHHRESPLNIMSGKSDAAPVWISEALYQKRLGHPIDSIAIPAAQNHMGEYLDAVVRRAPHRAAARAFVDFVSGAEAAAIYRAYGFSPARKG